MTSLSTTIHTRKSGCGFRCQVKFDFDILLNRQIVDIESTETAGFFSNKKILVTGGAGSIGRHIVKRLMGYKPYAITVIDHSEAGIYELEQEIKDATETRIDIVLASITDETRMHHIFDVFRPDIVIHAAAFKHVPIVEKHPYEAVRTNIFGTEILARLSMKYGVKKFVFISTDKAVNPGNVMGATKRFSEIYLQSLAAIENSITAFVTTRFGNVLGTQGSVIPLFAKQINQMGPVTITDAHVRRYFIAVREACHLVMEATAKGRAGEVYVLNMGQPIFLRDIADTMIRQAGFEPDRDMEVRYTGLRPGEKLSEDRMTDEEATIAHDQNEISIFCSQSPSPLFVKRMLTTLKQAMRTGNNGEIVLAIKKAVPEYVSCNSDFQMLDQRRLTAME